MRTFSVPCTYRLSTASLVLLASLLVLGCGSGEPVYPVQGKIVYKDGTPVTGLNGYTVTFESVEHMATADQTGIGGWGNVAEDGTFTIGTYKPADGAVLGKHRVAISPEPQLSDGPSTKPPIPLKYATVETSGIEVEVTPGTNRIDLTVERE